MSESLSGQPPVPPAADLSARPADAAPFALSQEPVTPAGPVPAPDPDATPAPAYEHLGELPATYGTQSVYLVAYDPHQLFAYWDLDWSAAPARRYALHVCRPDGELETRVDISAADAGRHVAVTRPCGTYYVELGAYGRDGSWQPVAHSSRVTLPPPGLSDELDPKFATLPFHLSFHRLFELIGRAAGGGEDLTGTLARLQRGVGADVSPLLGALDGLSGEHRETLENLLGQHLPAGAVSSPEGGVPGGDAPSILRDRHAVVSSGGAFGSGGLSSGAFGSETITSGGVPGGVALASGGAFGSESLSSGGIVGGRSLASGGAFGSGALAAGAFGSGGLSSGDFLALGAFGSESLSSGGPNSEAWRLAGHGAPGGSDLAGSELAAMFRQAVERNLDVLGGLFGGSSGGGASDGFSPGGW